MHGLCETAVADPASMSGNDRFPRTIPQAEALDKHVKIDVVVDLNIPDQVGSQ